jgi:hypothetical protein
MAVKFPQPVEFPDIEGEAPTPGATLSQVQVIHNGTNEDLEPPINLSVLFDNAIV